ncbi:MAG TPA: hypothetical protein VJB65_02335 [Patescibacteria group bacterium]|nr:hypothetical protein [Patescibacteria group bacterium]
MPLVFAAVVPNHPQLAMDCLTTGTDHSSQTCNALQELEGELYFMKPDTIIVLTSYGSQISDLFNINIANPISSTLKMHKSDVTAKKYSFFSDVEFAAHLKEAVDIQSNHLPVTVVAESIVQAEIAAPIRLLLNHLPNTRVIVISTAHLPVQKHSEFGNFLRQEILQTNKRVAIIAAGHLSEYRSTNTTTHEQQAFDTVCINALKMKQPEQILKINIHILDNSHTDVFAPLVVLLGAIHKLHTEPDVLSYEQLYHQGQLVTNFVLI